MNPKRFNSISPGLRADVPKQLDELHCDVVGAWRHTQRDLSLGERK
jgi:hypothetical protein